MGIWGRFFGRQEDEYPAPPSVTTYAADALMTEARGHVDSKRPEEAIALLETHAYGETMGREPLLYLSQLYIDQGERSEAEELLRIILERFPEEPRVYRGLGELALLTRNWPLAETYFRSFLELSPEDEKVTLKLAEALHKQDRFTEEKAILAPFATSLRPPCTETLYQLALAHYACGEYNEALICLDKLQDQGSTSEDSIASLLFTIHFYAGNFAEAKRIMERSLRLNPASPVMRFARGLFHLMQHEFTPGWSDYQYRLAQDPECIRAIHVPRWSGQSLIGKRIVVTQEQGLGDQIMFASCVPDLLKLGAEQVILEVNERLGPLFRRSFPNTEVIATKQNQDYSWLPHLGNLDYYIQIGDLPKHFRPNQLSFSNASTPYLHPRPGLQKPPPTHSKRLRVGLSWKGGVPTTRSFMRSLTIADLQPLLAIPNIDWISLQFRAKESEVAELRERLPRSTLFHQENVGQDLDELASLMETLDVVVTACNTNVHLGGALGKEVWVMTPLFPEWRYGLTDRMPWYPSVTLFRQDAGESWGTVIESLCYALQSLRES